MDANPWTRDTVRQRLAEAAHTLRRLPVPRNGRPAEYKTSWPDVALDWLAYGWTPTLAPRIPPNPAEISRLDECLAWISPAILTRDQRLIVWGRANGWTYRKLVALDDAERHGRGRQEHRLRTILGDAEARILAHLNRTQPRARSVAELHARGDQRTAAGR